MTGFISRLLAKVGSEFGQTFRSLKNPAYRTYAIGHIISMTGSQLQAVALAWTTYSITQSASKLGLTAMATYLPALLLGMLGGLVADRFDRRRILMAAQVAGFALAITLAALTFSGYISFGLILAFGFAQGLVNAIELPCRQAFVFDVVGADDTVNAVSLNSMIFQTTRLLGPALAAILLPLAGDAVCFALNGISFLAALITLSLLGKSVQPRVKQSSTEGAGASLRSGLKLVCTTPALRNVILLTASTSFFAFQYAIMLPVMVDKVLGGTAIELGLLTAAAAIGSMLGNLVLASRGRKDLLPRIIAISSLAPGVFLLLFALSNSFPLLLGAAALLSGSIAIQLGSSNSYLQLNVPQDFRGRVMSLYTSVLMGAVPFGSLLVGHVADLIGAPRALAMCALATLIAAVLYVLARSNKRDG